METCSAKYYRTKTKSVVLNETPAALYQCDLTALDAFQRKRRSQLASKTWTQILEKRELDTGYKFRFEFSPSRCSDIAELATLEHLCCPFFEIALTIEKNNGSLWLQITGDSGVKQFIRAEMGL